MFSDGDALSSGCKGYMISHVSGMPLYTDYSHWTKVREVLWRRFKRVVRPSYGTSAEAHDGLPWNQAPSTVSEETAYGV